MGRRSRRRGAPAAAKPGADRPAPAPTAERRSLRSPRRATSEERNAQVRAALEPLEPGQRPGAVTVAAIAAAVLALANLIAFLAGMEIDGEPPATSAIAATEILLGVMAVGMWKARYWAVLGFQFLLGLLLVSLSLLLLTASTIVGALLVLAIGVPAGWLFWKLVRAMARLQMPTRPGARR